MRSASLMSIQERKSMRQLYIIWIFLMTVLIIEPAKADDPSDFLKNARSKVAAATTPSQDWTGPVTGPVAQSGKKIVYVAADMRNGGIRGVSEGAQEAAQVIGWKFHIIDAEGTEAQLQMVFDQAMALQPDGIVLGGFDAKKHHTMLKAAAARGIAMVGWHVGPDPGPMQELPVFTNITTDSNDVAQIAAYYAIADSGGTAGVVIFTDDHYKIALAKSNAMAAIIRQCASCTLFSIENAHLAQAAEKVPELVRTLMQRHGNKLTHTLAINDLYYDFAAPTLASMGIAGDSNPVNLSAGDGSESAYERIRNGQYQAGTVPEPLHLHGWQVIDEMNRAFAQVRPSGYATPVHLTTAENIMTDGGPRNVYDPDNDYRAYYRRIWGK